jgi:hypothetical protein
MKKTAESYLEPSDVGQMTLPLVGQNSRWELGRQVDCVDQELFAAWLESPSGVVARLDQDKSAKIVIVLQDDDPHEGSDIAYRDQVALRNASDESGAAL